MTLKEFMRPAAAGFASGTIPAASVEAAAAHTPGLVTYATQGRRDETRDEPAPLTRLEKA